MLRRRMIVLLAAAALSIGLSQTIPAAYAAPVAHARAAAVSAVKNGSSSSIAGVSKIPLIQFRDCQSQSTTWVDLDILTSAGIQDWCFGYTGTWYFYSPYNEITAFCSGNNEGHLSYRLPDGELTGFSFGPGRLYSFAFGNHIYSLNITGWSGNDRCYS
jgi:hypothetical protein